MLTQNTGVIRCQYIWDFCEGNLAIQCVGSGGNFISILQYCKLILVCQKRLLYTFCIGFGSFQNDTALCTVGVGKYCIRCLCFIIFRCFNRLTINGFLNLQSSVSIICYSYFYCMNGVIKSIARYFHIRYHFLKIVGIGLACILLSVSKICESYVLSNVLHGLILVGITICFVCRISL